MQTINYFLSKTITNSFYLLVTLAFLLTGCDLGDSVDNGNNNNNENPATGNSESYDLQSTEGSSVSGTVSFAELEDGTTLVTLVLNGAEDGAEHPAHIHANSVVEGGGIDVALNSVDGSSGSSETEINSLNDGTQISYEDLIAYNGHVNVHLSGDDLAVIAAGDIGGNALTGQSMEYDLQEADGSGVSGIVRFEERVNENTLATIELTGTVDGVNHPAHIHENSVAEGGGVTVPFNSVDGATGIGQTNILADESMTYPEILDFDGHVNVHRSGDDLSVISAGDIGGNALTGESMEYDLQEIDGSGVSGTVRFEERVNENTLVTIELTGTMDGVNHPAHIHENSVEEGGGVVVPLNNVDGATGISQTNFLADETLSYSEALEYDGHVNVHTSTDDLSVISAGNIGTN